MMSLMNLYDNKEAAVEFLSLFQELTAALNADTGIKKRINGILLA